MRTQSLSSVVCSVHYWVSYAINKQGFWRLHLCRHTFPSLWGTCLLFASLWCANSRGDSCVLHVPLSNVCWGLLILSSDLKAFIFPKFAKVCYFVFVKHSSFKCLLNLRKVYIFHEFAEGLLSICVCWIIKILLSTKPSYFSAFSLENMSDSWCMHQTGLTTSAAIVPQSKFTGLCSSASIVPRSKSTEM